MIRRLLVLALLAPATWAAASRVQHTVLTGKVCSPSCSLSITSTGSGNLLVVGYATAAATTSTTISSVSGAGTWHASGACPATDTAGSDFVDLAYNLNSTSGVTSLTVTLSQNDTADFEVAEYSGGTWTLDGTCKAVSNPAATNPNTSGSITTAGSTDVIVAIWEGLNHYCSGEAVSGTGWTTPVLDVFTAGSGSAFDDAMNVTAGTYQAGINNINGVCPGAASNGAWASSSFAFTVSSGGASPVCSSLLGVMQCH